MPKRILIVAGSLLLAVVLILILPVTMSDPSLESRPTAPSTTESTATGSSGNGSSAAPTAPSANTSTTIPATTVPAMSTMEPTTVPTAPPTTIPTVPPTTIPPTTTLPPPPGQVRLYVCDASLLEAYAQLALEYYSTTGIEVILLSPTEGESCTDALARYMASDTPPTMFCIHQEATLQQYAHQLYDLAGTKAAGQLYSAGFGMYQGEKLLALPVAVDWFGYIFNANLLKDAAFTRDDFYRTDITGYNSMAYIAKYLKSVKSYPFGKPNFADTSDSGLAALLSTVFRDPDQMRSFIDLYVDNSYSTTNALTSFKSGKIVFYAGTTASFDSALVLGIDKLDLLPAFVRGSSTMEYICRDFWAVNGTGYTPDITETLAFLNWMVTARADGAAPIDSLGLLSPYKDAAVADNALEKLLRKYMAEEPARLVWDSRCVDQEKFADFCAALAAYYAKPNDTNWAAVAALMQS